MRPHKIAAVVLLLMLSVPAFGLRNVEEPSFYARLTRLVQRLAHAIVSNGNGLIGPIPAPSPDPNP